MTYNKDESEKFHDNRRGFRKRSMTKQFDRIIFSPKINKGKPTVGRAKVLVSEIFELIALGKKPEDIMQQYPGLDREDIKQAMQYSAYLLGRPLPE